MVKYKKQVIALHDANTRLEKEKAELTAKSQEKQASTIAELEQMFGSGGGGGGGYGPNGIARQLKYDVW